MTLVGRRRGAALLIVLLLAASLAFVALAVAESARRAADRASGLRARSEAAWIAFGAEQLAVETVDRALAASPQRLDASAPWLNVPISFPLEDGGSASIQIVDATRCFDLNSLGVTQKAGAAGKPKLATAEFEALLSSVASADAPPGLAGVVADWIDTDTFAEPQGAEDGAYLALPTPYRTGGGPLASPTELRAMAGVSAKTYAALAPFVCAHPDGTPRINVNMLTPRDAPMLAALFRGALTRSEAETIVAARPPGGFPSAAAFWALPVLKARKVDDALTGRVAVVSRYLDARIIVDRGGRKLVLTLLLEVSGQGKARVVSRRFGPIE